MQYKNKTFHISFHLTHGQSSLLAFVLFHNLSPTFFFSPPFLLSSENDSMKEEQPQKGRKAQIISCRVVCKLAAFQLYFIL